jgi:hypothetical protein
MKTDWAVMMEFDCEFDLTEDMLGEIVSALDAPCSWDAMTRRFTATVNVRNVSIDAVLSRARGRIANAVLHAAGFAAATEAMRITLVAIEAMTFAEQDRRLGASA